MYGAVVEENATCRSMRNDKTDDISVSMSKASNIIGPLRRCGKRKSKKEIIENRVVQNSQRK